MPLFKDYGDNIAKWLNPSPEIENIHQDWKWGSKDVEWPNYDIRMWQWKGEPTLRMTKAKKPQENVYDGRNCFGLVFGWTSVETLGIPYLRLSLKKEMKISKRAFNTPMMCFIVFVGGKLGKIVGDTSLPLLVAAATFQIQQREFEGFEIGN